MLKTIGSSEKLALRAFKASNNKVVKGSDRANETVVDLFKFKNKKFRKWTRVLNIGAMGEPNFLILNAKKAFNHLRLAFIKVPILQYFDSKSHIRIETDVSSYAIGRVLSQLNLNSNAPLNDLNLDKSDFGQWDPVTYFSRKMILIKTQYKTHNAELLTIVEAFKN